MTGKSVNFNPNPRNKTQPSSSALDAFVKGDAEQVTSNPKRTEKKPTKRLTFDIDTNLHRRIRMACITRDKDMAEELRRILEENFPV